MEVWIEIAFNTWETRSRSNRKFDITPFEQQQTLRWRLPCDQLHLALVCSLHLLDKQCLYSSLQPCWCFLLTPSLTHKLESLNPSTLRHLTCLLTVSASEAVSLESKLAQHQLLETDQLFGRWVNWDWAGVWMALAGHLLVGKIGSCWWAMATGPPTPTPLLSYSTQLGLGNLPPPSQFHQPTCCFLSEAGNLSSPPPHLFRVLAEILPKKNIYF